MTATMNQARIYLQHRRLIFWSFFIPVLLLVPLSVFSHVKDQGDAMTSTYTLLILVTSAAFFLASVQQEMSNKSVCFMMPNVRLGMRNHQLITGLVIFGASLGATFFVPGLVTMVQGTWAMSVSLASLMLLGYTLTLLVSFQFATASLVPYSLTWLGMLIIGPLQKVHPEFLQRILGQTPLLLVVVALMIYLGWLQTRSRAVQRSLAQRAYISVAEMRNEKRVEEFKRARNLHKVAKGEQSRPLAGLLRAMNRRVASCRAGRDYVQALVWESGVLWLSASLPRSPWILALYIVSFPVAMSAIGYFESWRSLVQNESYEGWMMGLIFGSLVSVTGLMAHHLRVRTLGRLISRPDMLRAGWLGGGVMVTIGLVLGLVLFALGHLLAAVLPVLTISGHGCTVVPPKAYLIGTMVFVLPVQLLVFILWPRPKSPRVLQQAGLYPFYAFFWLCVGLGSEALVPILSIASVAWVAAAISWYWRVMVKGDA